VVTGDLDGALAVVDSLDLEGLPPQERMRVEMVRMMAQRYRQEPGASRREVERLAALAAASPDLQIHHHALVFRALAAGLEPIFCVGESLRQREEGETEAVIEHQLKEGLNNLTASDIEKSLIAYEPVWAIGTGKTASPGQAEDVHRFIREWIVLRYGPESGAKLAILYGGSVTPKNIAELMDQPDINGALVGGASLDVDSFIRLVGY